MSDVVRNPKQLGNLIRNARLSQKLSQQDLGTRAGLWQPTVSVIEKGNAATRLDTILALLAALDLELTVEPRSKDWDKDIEQLF